VGRGGAGGCVTDSHGVRHSALPPQSSNCLTRRHRPVDGPSPEHAFGGGLRRSTMAFAEFLDRGKSWVSSPGHQTNRALAAMRCAPGEHRDASSKPRTRAYIRVSDIPMRTMHMVGGCPASSVEASSWYLPAPRRRCPAITTGECRRTSGKDSGFHRWVRPSECMTSALTAGRRPPARRRGCRGTTPRPRSPAAGRSRGALGGARRDGGLLRVGTAVVHDDSRGEKGRTGGDPAGPAGGSLPRKPTMIAFEQSRPNPGGHLLGARSRPSRTATVRVRFYVPPPTKNLWWLE
jgi:hypothetical protein